MERNAELGITFRCSQNPNRVSVNVGRTPEPLKPELQKPPEEATAHLAGVQSAFTSDARAWRGFRSNRSRG
jgi:hypothetical protein